MVPKTRAPLQPSSRRDRPLFDSALTRLSPNVAKSLQEQLKKNPLCSDPSEGSGEDRGADEIRVGEACKNGGCKKVRMIFA